VKNLPFFAGVLAGFGLASLLVAVPSPPATPALPAESGSTPRAAGGTGAAPAGENFPSPSAPPPAPARRKPGAFLFAFAIFRAPTTNGLSAEDAADPQFIETYRRAVSLSARNDFAPWAGLLHLNPGQFDALVEIAADQALAYRALSDANIDRPLLAARKADLSARAEARLDAVLSPEQMETLAGTSLFGTWSAAASLDAFAAHDAPLSPAQESHLWKTEPAAGTDGNYVSHTISLEAAEPWMTPEQRRLLANQRRWAEAAAFKQSLALTKVRDPELKDLWPGP
jgi:hypothetical protein